MTEPDHAAALHSLVKGQRFAMFTTVGPTGVLVSRPMTIQDQDGWILRFVTQADNDVASQAGGQQVNIAIVDGGTYISLSGTGHLHNDLVKKQELWNRLNEAYAGDAADPNNVVLEVAIESGEYWQSGNPIARVAGLAKAVVTGVPPEAKHGATEV